MSDGVESAVHCLSLLSFLPPDRTLSVSRLAEMHGIQAPYLSKHMQALVRAGIVESGAGARGGFRLARRPEKISLLDVVEAVDGAEPAFRCKELRQRGPTALAPECYERPCGIAAAFGRADTAWRAALRETTLAQLLGDLPKSVDPRQLEKTKSWLEEALR